jgi:hypothetical protein
MEHWDVTAHERDLVITARDHDRSGAVHKAAATFVELAEARPDGFRIIADLREMTGYETESRKAWTAVFSRFRSRIDRLVLVGARSALIRMGAATVGALSGIPVRFVDSINEIDDE